MSSLKILKSRDKSTQNIIMINWYLKVVRDNYANFYGRARRSEYWYYTLCGAIIGLLLRGVDYLIGLDYEIVGTLYSLAVFIPGLAVLVRRMHDWQKRMVCCILYDSNGYCSCMVGSKCCFSSY